MEQFQSTPVAADKDSPTLTDPITEAFKYFVRGAIKEVENCLAKNPRDVTFWSIIDNALRGGTEAIGAKVCQMFVTKICLDGGLTIRSKMSEDAKAIQRGASAVGGGMAGALHQFIKNALYERQLKKEDFLDMMRNHHEVICMNAEILWNFMCSIGIVVDEKIAVTQLPPQLLFPSHLKCCEESIRYVLKQASFYCLTKNIVKAGIRGTIIGREIADEDIGKLEQIIHQIGKDRSQKVLQRIAWGGTLEIQIFCNIYKIQVVVHHLDGEMKVFDPQLPAAERKQVFHLSYDRQHKHYRPADERNIPSNYPETDGNCLYNSLAFHMVKDPKEIDDKASDIKENIGFALATISETLYNINVDDLKRGGGDLGAGRPKYLPKFMLTKNDQIKALISLTTLFPDHDPSVISKQAKEALRALQSLSIKEVNQMKDKANRRQKSETVKGRKGPNNIHALTENLIGLLAVDVDINDIQERGKARLLFDIQKRKYYTTLSKHNYKDVIWPCGVKVIRNNSLILLRQTNKRVDIAVKCLESLQNVKHLRELSEQESISVVSDTEGRKVCLDLGFDGDIIFRIEHNPRYLFYYST